MALVYLSICHSRAFSGTWKVIPRGLVQHMANSYIERYPTYAQRDGEKEEESIGRSQPLVALTLFSMKD